ncbi:MAG: hypothetical protein COB67_09825 [SAR324 cluster bacterium]|uniref:Uncharacterized protein n=1 Tax=SAR324 cluster bacterium TaxID=2024889 RepID=A0A2A4T048_9DELT|nr:MAG: hypothetical protein COB67_09825 [SAR324 cluster bacterium]
MLKLLTERETAKEIRELTQNSTSLKFAVAFWGDGSIDSLEINDSPDEIKIICNLLSGATNPSVIKTLQENEKVDLRHHPQLHAKVYWTKNRGIVGSSNASANGLNFEGKGSKGWFEANLLTEDRSVLNQLEVWFDGLWQQSEDINSEVLEEASLRWKLRRKSRVNRSGKVKESLLQALFNDPEDFKDRGIKLALYFTGERSQLANEGLEEIKKSLSIEKSDELDCYEDWEEIPPGTDIIDIYLGSRGGVNFGGLWHIPDESPHRVLKNEKIEEKTVITLCHRLKTINGRKLSEADKNLIKKHMRKLREKYLAEEDAVLIDIHDAREILIGKDGTCQ